MNFSHANGFDGEGAPIIQGSALKALEGDAEYQAKIIELVDAMDSYFPEPERELDKPFLMPIEDIFSIEGRGTVVTGRVERGSVKVGEKLKSLVSRKQLQLLLLVLKCSTSSLTKRKLETTLVSSCEELRRRKSTEVRFSLQSDL